MNQIENSEITSDKKKVLFCWHCLRRVRWFPNPHQIKDMIDLQNRPELERKIIMPAYGIDPIELVVNPYVRAREWGVHRLNPWAHYPSVMNLLDGAIEWREEEGEYVPCCPYCSRPLANQNKWKEIKGWVKYPFIVIGVFFLLWLLGRILGRDILFIG